MDSDHRIATTEVVTGDVLDIELTDKSADDLSESKLLKRFHLLLFAVLILLSIYWLSTAILDYLRPAENAYLAIESGDYQLAAAQLKEYAESGNIKAGTSLANLYWLGLGVQQDYKTAARLYSSSARQGDAAGMVNLGLMYRDGLGVEKDVEIAYAWLNLGRGLRNEDAQVYMSELLASHEVKGNRVPDLRRLYSTIASMPELSFD